MAIVSVIDDDESVRAATSGFVRSLGHEVRAFASAEAFLQSPCVNETACVIADVQMPKMSGLDLQTHLRAQGFDTPIIFITAFPDGRLKARALGEGAVCFLSKPCDGDTLVRCLAEALARPADHVKSSGT